MMNFLKSFIEENATPPEGINHGKNNVFMRFINELDEIYFLYIFQLYNIITLSLTLKNLILSVVYKFNQLMNVFYLMTILNFIFSGIAFFHFSLYFIREIPISIIIQILLILFTKSLEILIKNQHMLKVNVGLFFFVLLLI